MTKRIISIFLIILVFIFNCCPVFALDSYSLVNFINVDSNTFTNDIVNFINSKLENNYIYYTMFRRYGFNNQVVISSQQPLELQMDGKKLVLVNLSTEITVISSNVGDDFEIPGGQSNYFDFGGDTNFSVEPILLIYKTDCVSNDYCSPDIYVEYKEDTGDYEEGGVVIKGLTAFFNKMTSALNDILETIKGIVDSIIGIPDEGYFASKIETIKESINAKYNLDSLFGFFEDMKNIESTVPNFSFDKDLSINGQTFPFDFYIDFSWFDGEIKNIIFLLFRAVGYPSLIIYNLNQVYLLFRGRKFFDNDGGEE